MPTVLFSIETIAPVLFSIEISTGVPFSTEIYVPFYIENDTSLVQYWIKCGKSNCRCRKGKGHGPYSYLSARIKGKTRLKLVPKEMILRIEEAVRRYREYQNNFGLIRRLNKEVERLIKRLRHLLLSKSPYRFP